jgi:hypothetical protein
MVLTFVGGHPEVEVKRRACRYAPPHSTRSTSDSPLAPSSSPVKSMYSAEGRAMALPMSDCCRRSGGPAREVSSMLVKRGLLLLLLWLLEKAGLRKQVRVVNTEEIAVFEPENEHQIVLEGLESPELAAY